MTGLTRRQILLSVIPTGVCGIAFARAVRAADACVGPDTESLRTSLNYTSTGTDAAATCAHCAFFTADAGGGCGACKILGGAVDRSGHCDSFSPPA